MSISAEFLPQKISAHFQFQLLNLRAIKQIILLRGLQPCRGGVACDPESYAGWDTCIPGRFNHAGLVEGEIPD